MFWRCIHDVAWINTSFLFGAKFGFIERIHNTVFPFSLVDRHWVVSGLCLLFVFLSPSVKEEQGLVCICLICCYETTNTFLEWWSRPSSWPSDVSGYTEEFGHHGRLLCSGSRIGWARVWHRTGPQTTVSGRAVAAWWESAGREQTVLPSTSPTLSRPELQVSTSPLTKRKRVLDRKEVPVLGKAETSGHLSSQKKHQVSGSWGRRSCGPSFVSEPLQDLPRQTSQ